MNFPCICQAVPMAANIPDGGKTRVHMKNSHYIDNSMSLVTISRSFRITIPRPVRLSLGLRTGQKMLAMAYDGRVEFIPVRRMHEMRGFLHGMNTQIQREDADAALME